MDTRCSPVGNDVAPTPTPTPTQAQAPDAHLSRDTEVRAIPCRSLAGEIGEVPRTFCEQMLTRILHARSSVGWERRAALAVIDAISGPALAASSGFQALPAPPEALASLLGVPAAGSPASVVAAGAGAGQHRVGGALSPSSSSSSLSPPAPLPAS